MKQEFVVTHTQFVKLSSRVYHTYNTPSVKMLRAQQNCLALYCNMLKCWSFEGRPGVLCLL